MKESGPVEKFRKLFVTRDVIAAKWKKSGKKVVGCISTYTPEEIIYAAEALPVRARGIVFLSSRSCKATSIGNLTIQKVLREEYGVPSVVIEADHTDDRVYSEAEVTARLDAFMEVLGAK